MEPARGSRNRLWAYSSRTVWAQPFSAWAWPARIGATPHVRRGMRPRSRLWRAQRAHGAPARALESPGPILQAGQPCARERPRAILARHRIGHGHALPRFPCGGVENPTEPPIAGGARLRKRAAHAARRAVDCVAIVRW